MVDLPLRELLPEIGEFDGSLGVRLSGLLKGRLEANPACEKHLRDLAWAQAAAIGFEGAVTHLTRMVLHMPLSRKVARVSEDSLTEARQRLLERLLVGDECTPPKILSYEGNGPLEGFLRISLAREALQIENQRRPRNDDVHELLALHQANEDPEVQYFKALYRDKYRRSFARAAESLSARERTLLRQHLLLGLSIDRLADLYQVHRATAARWVDDAREMLMSRTRRELEAELGLGRDELERIAQLIASRLEFSFHRVLASREIPAPEKKRPSPNATGDSSGCQR